MADLRETTEHKGSLEDFLRVIFRRKAIVISALTVALVAVLFTILGTERTFRSYAKLLVSRGRPATAFSANMRVLSWEEELTSELETIQSAKIYKRAQELLDEQSFLNGDGTPYQIVPGGIDASTLGKANIIHILYDGADAATVQAVVRTLTQAYREFRARDRMPDPSGYIEEEIVQLEGEIGEWEQQRADFLVREGAVQLAEERTGLLNNRKNIQNELALVRTQIAERQAQREWISWLVDNPETADAATSIYPFTETGSRGESSLIHLRSTILATKAEYYEARAQYTESHPAVLALRDRLTELNGALIEEAAGYARYLEALVTATVAKDASLQATLDYINEELGTFPDREAQMARLDRMIGSLRHNYDALVNRRIDAMTARVGSSSWDVVILQDAVEAFPVRTKDYVRLAVIPLFSLIIGLGLAFMRDSLDHSLKDRAEAEAHLRVPVLATVSRFRK